MGLIFTFKTGIIDIHLNRKFEIVPVSLHFFRCVTQSLVGLRNLGQFHRQSFKDSTGSVVFVAVRHVTDVKNVNKNAYVRWTPLDKLQPCSSLGLAYDSETTAFDIVATAVRVRFIDTLFGTEAYYTYY